MKDKVPQSQDELWTKSEAAKFFRVNIRTIESWMAQGVLPYFKFGRRTVRFRARHLQEHIERTCLRINNVRRRLAHR